MLSKGSKIHTKEVKGKKVPKAEVEWDGTDTKLMQINAMAMDMLDRASHFNQFILVATCESTKEIWDKLEVIYEGTDRVKQSMIMALEEKYDSSRCNQMKVSEICL